MVSVEFCFKMLECKLDFNQPLLWVAIKELIGHIGVSCFHSKTGKLLFWNIEAWWSAGVAQG